MSFTPSTQDWQSQLPFSSPTTGPIMSPTSAPQPSKAVPERKAKLRASCDACAASKVKCSKEHPICSRCASNGSQCIYGISRKHGKPGRTRKKNPDGTPFIKASKQRPSPDGSEFGKFRVQAQPMMPETSNMPQSDTSSWPSTPEWPATPEFDYSMTPDTAFSDADFTFMDDILMTNTQTSNGAMQTIQPELTFRNPFEKKESLQLELPLSTDFQTLKDFIGGESVNPLEYALSSTSADSFIPSSTPPESPKGSTSYFNPLRTSIAMPTSHCCYSLAYATLESLQFRTLENPTGIELKSLDSVLSVTKTAVQSVLQLLSCPCASDPHLAMLYSSIASKIITWYQITAGVRPTASPNAPSTPGLSTTSSSPSLEPSSTFSSPLSTPNSTSSAFNIKLQPLKIGLFEFDEADQEALRRQVVLRELKKCGTLIEALANWKSGAEAEQAEFLYDVLGAWLKSELYRTLREVAGGEE